MTLLVKNPKTTAETSLCLDILHHNYGKGLVIKGTQILSIKERELAEDIAYDLAFETLDIAIKRIKVGSISSEDHLKHWLYQVFTRKVLMYLRVLPKDLYFEEFKEDTSIEDDFDDEASAIKTDTESYNIADEVSGYFDEDKDRTSSIDVWTLLNTLSNHEKNLVLLRARDELPYDQIAKQLNVTNVDLLRKQYERAVKKLKKAHVRPTSTIKVK